MRRLIIEEFYDEKNPRFELELFGESSYAIDYSIVKLNNPIDKITYNPPSNRKKEGSLSNKTMKRATTSCNTQCCEICGKAVSKENCITANKGATLVCKSCFKKLF